MKELTAQAISSMSYIDFIASVNQWNTLPGSYTTLSKWATFSRMTEASRLLEVACTTGFSSRELTTLTNCTAFGFDLSADAIRMAEYNRDRYAPQARLTYQQSDGLTIRLPKKFTHVAIGAALGFFPDSANMLERCVGWLENGGYLLAAPFYAIKTVPDELLAHCQKIFGITITNRSYHEILRLYRGLETIFEERNTMVIECEEELQHYCTSTIDRACEMSKIISPDARSVAYQRLLEIKRATNMLREYQNYCVLVLRYRSSIYPHRFAELF